MVSTQVNQEKTKRPDIERADNTFEKVAREWFGKFQPGWAPSHAVKIKGRLENDVYPLYR